MNYPNERPRHPTSVCTTLLERFLLEPSELLAALAPEGWEHSPLFQIFHPTAEQRLAEHEALQRHLASLFKGSGSEPGSVEEEGALEGALDETPARPIEPERENVEILGHALWGIFSNNHSVVDQDGTEYDLGSFRGSARFIADVINARYPELGRAYDYIDFYMGTSMLRGRADLRPAYRWIFAQLRETGCDWIYSFPRVYLIDFRGGPKVSDDDPLTYDPSEAVRAEFEGAAEQEEHDKLKAELDSAYEEAVRQARDAPLPAVVGAYREVYGVLPEGWPHSPRY